jgi:hypothetical protein
MTRGQQSKEDYTTVGGEAAPGFFERIRQREKLESDARTFMRNEGDARRMLRNAYQRAVRRGEYNPSLLYAHQSLRAARDKRNEQYKTGLKSDFDATMDFIREYQAANKNEEAEPFNRKLLELTEGNNTLREEGIIAAEALRKKQEEELAVKGKKPATSDEPTDLWETSD